MQNTWTTEQIIDEIKKIVKETFDIDLADKDGATKIADLGLDSMGVLDVIMSLEDLTGRKFNEIALPKNPSLEEVAAFVVAELASGA